MLDTRDGKGIYNNRSTEAENSLTLEQNINEKARHGSGF